MDKIEEIKKLINLLEQGAITEEEFKELKKRIFEEKGIKAKSDLKQIKKHKSSSRYKVIIPIISLFIIVYIFVYGLPSLKQIQAVYNNFEKKIFSSEGSANNNSHLEESNVIYEGGDRLGKLVEIRLENSQKVIFDLKIPDGKIWTPLYYEAYSSECSFPSIPKIFTARVKGGGGWFSGSEIIFPEKEEFNSYKKAIRNNKALSDEFGILLWPCNPSTYLLFFLEQ